MVLQGLEFWSCDLKSGGTCGLIQYKVKNLNRVWHAANPLEIEECLRERGHRWYMAVVSPCHMVLQGLDFRSDNLKSSGACGLVRCKAKNFIRIWHAANPLEREGCLREHRNMWCIAVVSPCHMVLQGLDFWSDDLKSGGAWGLIRSKAKNLIGAWKRGMPLGTRTQVMRGCSQLVP